MDQQSRQVVAAALRHAAAVLTGGLIEYPPAMFDDIMEWALATVAATRVAELKKDMAGVPAMQAKQKALFAPLEKAMKPLRKDPTSWKLYKAYIAERERVLHTPNRLKIREFQKLTPEKKQATTQKVLQGLDGTQEEIDRRVGSFGRTDELERSIAAYKPYLRSGVKAMDKDEVHKNFPIDLSGWKHATEAMRKKLDERLRERQKVKLKELESDIEEFKLDAEDETLDPKKRKRAQMRVEMWEEDLAEIKKAMKKGKFKDWDSIELTLATEPVNKEAAYWDGLLRQVRLVIPYHAEPEAVEAGLSWSLKHELRHFAQAWMSFIVKNYFSVDFVTPEREGSRRPKPMPSGMPSKKIRTPEFRQDMAPGRSGADSPEAKALIKKLHREGVNVQTIDFHSLDDVEFYTKLADAIGRWNAMEKRNPFKSAKDKRLAIRLFTGEGINNSKLWKQGEKAFGYYHDWKVDWFFGHLSRTARAKGKLRKARSEFVKAVL